MWLISLPGFESVIFRIQGRSGNAWCNMLGGYHSPLLLLSRPIEFNIILPSMIRSSKWTLPFIFSDKNLYAFLSSHVCYMPHDLIIQMIFGNEYFTNYETLHYVIFSNILSHLVSNILVSIMASNTLSLYKKSYLCNRPRGPMELWDVEAPTFSRQSAHRWR
jgi:hypothetical protein